jgi:hypothetical protein
MAEEGVPMSGEVCCEYHGPECPTCTDLRENVRLGPVEIVFHCLTHGPFVDGGCGNRASCPQCGEEPWAAELVQSSPHGVPPD